MRAVVGDDGFAERKASLVLAEVEEQTSEPAVGRERPDDRGYQPRLDGGKELSDRLGQLRLA
jgi:hypothetical protein